jgi:hypothetical protein
MHLITSQNSNAKDIIKYCLSMGADEKNIPSYFFKRLLDSQSIIFNQQNTAQLLKSPAVNLGLKVFSENNLGEGYAAKFITYIDSSSFL